jgi:hypothetical protein
MIHIFKIKTILPERMVSLAFQSGREDLLSEAKSLGLLGKPPTFWFENNPIIYNKNHPALPALWDGFSYFQSAQDHSLNESKSFGS